MIFVQKIGSRSYIFLNLYFCIFWPIGEFALVFEFQDTSQMTIFDLLRRLSRINTQNNVFLFLTLQSFYQSLWWLYRAHQLQLVSPSPSCFIVYFFSSLARTRYLSLFSLSSSFSLQSTGMAKSTIPQILSFVDYYEVWSSGRDYMIRLYLKIPENFVRLILQDRFCVFHIPFVCMFKFKLLAQFSQYHLPPTVMSTFILFLR